MLFDKKSCIYIECPEKDKANFCEITVMAQNIAKDLIVGVIKGIKSTEEEKANEDTSKKKLLINPQVNNKLKDMPLSPPSKEHKTTEHIEHRDFYLKPSHFFVHKFNHIITIL